MLRIIAIAILLGGATSFTHVISRNKLHVGVVGAPFDKGQPKEGVRHGTVAIKNTGVLEDLQKLGANLTDYGNIKLNTPLENVPGPDGEKWHTRVLEYSRLLSNTVEKAVRETDVCLTIGGDHSIAIGTVNGHSRACPEHQVVLMWVDAHADVNLPTTSPSGNMHGMPVAFHLRELADKVNKLPDGWPNPSISAPHLCYIGLRDVDPGEVRMIEELGIQGFYARDIESMGLDAVVKTCLNRLNPSETRPLHVSFDIDALDPLEARSTGTPVRGGLTLREGLGIVEAARNTGFLRALDLVEVNPELGNRQEDAEETAQAARLVILAALAGYRGA